MILTIDNTDIQFEETDGQVNCNYQNPTDIPVNYWKFFWNKLHDQLTQVVTDYHIQERNIEISKTESDEAVLESINISNAIAERATQIKKAMDTVENLINHMESKN